MAKQSVLTPPVDDQRQFELELPVYDALYAWAQREADLPQVAALL